MGEKIRRKKEKLGKTVRALMLGTELLAAGAAIGALAAREPTHAAEQDTHYKDFRRNENVSDRYGQTPEAIRMGQENADLEPELPINDDALNSSLAKDAGIDHIEKSPAQIMRERKAKAEATAKRLAEKARQNWERERARKQK